MKGFQPPPRYGGAMMSSEPLPITKTITVTEGISVKDLAEKLDVRGKDLIATLLMKGVFVTVNQSLDGELVKDVARQFGADATVISVEEQLENEAIEGFLEDTTGMVEITRSPVVTVMGHVDHGKTSLLDAIRSTDVAAGEAGGITQHIGAYKVKITKPDSPAFGREIVFLDTPGHEAFTRMRARGAKITDIVVVVVAADDGVMPQTLEAIDHAKAANVPIIVAVNKIDKPDANPDRVKQQLADRGLQPEAWGGTTVFVDVSAKKRTNLDLLEEMICLVADVANLKAVADRPAVGTVIEAKLDRGRGAVASVLVQNGTLKTGDSYIVGNTFGKIRAMFNDRGQPITEAGPSTPVEILGLEGMPDAGDTFLVMADRDKAKGIAQYRKMKEREAQLAKRAPQSVTSEGLAEQIKHAGVKDLNLIVKGDVQGSVEVIAEDLQRMSTEKVRVRVLHSGRGRDYGVRTCCWRRRRTRSLSGSTCGLTASREEVAEREGVEIRLHSIIYELRTEIEKAIVRTAGTGVQGELRGQGGSAQRLQDHQGRSDCRLPRDRWHHYPDRSGSRDARGHGGLARQDRIAEALQGRRVRSAAGRGVRHRPERLQGYPRRRCDRVVHYGEAGRRAGTELHRSSQGGEGSRSSNSGRSGRGCRDGERLKQRRPFRKVEKQERLGAIPAFSCC